MINIFSIAKIINLNGCWIPLNRFRDKDGYTRISINHLDYRLHRLALALDRNLDYHDHSWDTRHAQGCDRSCFNPEHLSPGTHKDNMQDKLKHGTNHNKNKLNCPKCGGEYLYVTRRSGPRKGMKFRQCRNCANLKRRKVKTK